jgi:hypothetical protein
MNKLYVKVIDGEVVGYPMLDENVIQECMLNHEIHYEGVTEEFILSHGYAKFEKPTLKTGEYVIDGNNATIELVDGVARPVLNIKEMTQAEKVDNWVRTPRNFDLVSSDWTQMPDAPLSSEKKAEWAAYRQELRDLTKKYKNVKDPKDVVPPTKPAL